MADYTTLIKSIENRYNPDSLREVRENSISSLSGIDKDIIKYVKLAMNEVDPIYTNKTLEAGENAKLHLQRELQQRVDFRYQGSVMTRTHIRGVSDIDLLTITSKFQDTDYSKAKEFVEKHPYSYDTATMRIKNWINNFTIYTGDTNNDLRQLRMEDERILTSHYVMCDITKPKSIRITNQNLHRNVDVVVASWHDSLEYISGKGDAYRGIYIYDKQKNDRLGPDYPFLCIDRINTRSTYTEGRLKKMIRFLKNVKADASVNIDLTSFDINAICYDINTDEYRNSYYLDLVRVLWLKLYHLCQNESEANNLKSVGGTEYIFRYNPSKIENLKRLHNEVWNIYNEIR
ncbi:MAG: hypothetical protein K2I90_05270 [Odoribacter sp.]|nr:hypothetical protein [Odoribacter sp.]